MKTVAITGISGTLGSALGREYLSRGWRVIGFTRQEKLEGDYYTHLCVSSQTTLEDVQPAISK